MSQAGVEVPHGNVFGGPDHEADAPEGDGERVSDDAEAPLGGLDRSRRLVRHLGEDATARLADLRSRIPAVEIGLRVYERDKRAAGTLLGSALALRLFLFFVPLMLFVVGLAGLLGRFTDFDSAASTAGLSGTLASEIDGAFDQGATTPWFAIAAGLFGIATTGRSLTRALVLSSALCWQLGGRQKLRMRSIGIVVGIVVGMGLISSILNRVRDAAGIAVASVSFVVVAAIYLVLWSLLFLALPRKTTDPGAALPGAACVALILTGLQMVSQLYLPGRIDSATSIYGGLGIAVAFLGWFFILGRSMAFSFALNAVLYEEVGSVSQFVFGLPGLRLIPRRAPAVARFFDLEATDPSASDEAQRPQPPSSA